MCLKILFLGFTLFAVSTAGAVPASAPSVLTPFGHRPPTHVHHVPQGVHVLCFLSRKS
ncbi:hypothetical protein DL93DRAFT_2084210 [Clavulina sp. PMI_390]|nr:hypothetical protein DL93DRAFT_2084210 [Clavulina sp. PMI_390]